MTIQEVPQGFLDVLNLDWKVIDAGFEAKGVKQKAT